MRLREATVPLLRLATFFHRENVYIFGTLKTTGFH